MAFSEGDMAIMRETARMAAVEAIRANEDHQVSLIKTIVDESLAHHVSQKHSFKSIFSNGNKVIIVTLILLLSAAGGTIGTGATEIIIKILTTGTP